MRILNELKNKNIHIYPIKQLVKTSEKNYNLDRIKSISSLNNKLVYNSVIKCLEILDEKIQSLKILFLKFYYGWTLLKLEQKKREKSGKN